ncbi:MAG: CTP synthase [Planctomycetia bacterium]|nr:CTP synthase [Planctomycetia bacterium]
MAERLKIAIVADHDPGFRPHAATDEALAHSAAAIRLAVETLWIGTEELSRETVARRLADVHGVFIAPGSPYKSLDGALSAIRVAREQSRPLLGTCAGFQHVILEYARNVLGFEDAQHAEYDPNASLLFIAKLECSLVGRALPITLRAGSQAAAIYGQTHFTEQYYCQFGVNPEHVVALTAGSLRAVGSDAEGEVRVVELAGHPFFLATLFLPQYRSTPNAPHPLVNGFLSACAQAAASAPPAHAAGGVAARSTLQEKL